MYSYFSDLQVQLLARGILQPGEQLVGQTVTQYNPWWAFGLVRKTYLLLATDQRLVMLEHRVAWLHQALRLDSVDSIPWANVEEARLKGIFAKKIRLRAQGERGPKRLTMTVPNALFGLLAPMRNNMAGARNVVGAFQTPRALPQAGYAAPQFGAGAYDPPPQNAPGYASTPPAANGYAPAPQAPAGYPPGPYPRA